MAGNLICISEYFNLLSGIAQLLLLAFQIHDILKIVNIANNVNAELLRPLWMDSFNRVLLSDSSWNSPLLIAYGR